MSYQLRHKEFGIYQGNCIGLGFWHPMSEMPEQGFCEFPTLEDIKEHITFLITESSGPLKREDLSIEPYDKTKSEAMQAILKNPTDLDRA